MQTRPIKEIAQEIQKDWTSMPQWVKECYFDPLLEIDSIEDDYYADSAKSVVLYFLANASTWREKLQEESRENSRIFVIQ